MDSQTAGELSQEGRVSRRRLLLPHATVRQKVMLEDSGLGTLDDRSVARPQGRVMARRDWRKIQQFGYFPPHWR